MNENISTNEKTKKTAGPIRWNAIIPFVIICALIYSYFLLFFDTHMKSAIEWGAYKALGTELNVGSFKSSFINGNVRITKIELTDKEQPQFNSLELGDVRFDLNWNALLKVKFVVEEIGIDGIQFMSKRARPGRIAPPTPESDEPGLAQQLQGKALDKLDKEHQNNVIGDTAQFLKTGKFDDQIKSMQDQILAKKLLEEMNLKWKTKKTDWDGKLKTLPSGEELNALKDKFNKIKLKDFANLQELDASVKEANAVLQEVDAKTKLVQQLKSEFDADLKSLDQDYKNVEQQVKKDIDNLKSRFQIPKIDAANFAKELFKGYLMPYLQKVDSYKAMAQKYLPPKYAKMVAGEKTEKVVDDSIQPHPRSKGVTYEFPIKNGYPLLWIQKIKISSKSNTQADYGDFSGLISHITSNQSQIGQATTLKIDGNYNKFQLSGIKLNAQFNNLGPEPIVKFEAGINSYPISDIKLLDSKDGQISIPKTISNFNTTGELVNFKKYDLKLVNTFSAVNFNISAQDETISQVLKSTLGTINKFDLQASAKGELADLSLDIRSSLGGDLERAFQNLLQNKIKEANEKLQAAVSSEIDKLKQQLNSQIENLKQQTQGEIKKIQSQVDEQKKLVEEKVALAKKEFDDKMNKAKKDAEDQAKKKVEQEAQKQVNDLKKKLGL